MVLIIEHKLRIFFIPCIVYLKFKIAIIVIISAEHLSMGMAIGVTSELASLSTQV